MRCRKVRSFLSAYCKGELTEKRTGVISAHLEGCPICRSELTTYRQIDEAVNKLPDFKVSDDFNSRLLKRVAEERFQETRTKAYMPKKIPVLTFNRLAPVVAAACFIFAFAFTGGIDKFIGSQPETETSSAGLDDSWSSVMPESDHVMYSSQTSNWDFSAQFARASRIKGLMNQLAGQNSFGTLTSSSQNSNQMPLFMRNYYQVPRYYRSNNRPIIYNTVRGDNSDR